MVFVMIKKLAKVALKTVQVNKQIVVQMNYVLIGMIMTEVEMQNVILPVQIKLGDVLDQLGAVWEMDWEIYNNIN